MGLGPPLVAEQCQGRQTTDGRIVMGSTDNPYLPLSCKFYRSTEQVKNDLFQAALIKEGRRQELFGSSTSACAAQNRAGQ